MAQCHSYRKKLRAMQAENFYLLLQAPIHKKNPPVIGWVSSKDQKVAGLSGAENQPEQSAKALPEDQSQLSNRSDRAQEQIPLLPLP